MRILAATTAAPCRLSEKVMLTDRNQKSDELAKEVQAESNPLFSQDDFVYVQDFAKEWEVLPTQRKNEPVLLKDTVKAKPFTLKHRVTQSELSRALEAANAFCSKTVALPTLGEKITLPLLSLKADAIPENIKLKAKELKSQFDSVERFISRLPSLLNEDDTKRLGEPCQEFKARLETVKEGLTRADCLGDLAGIKTAMAELDTLISDLTTLSATLSQSQSPDVKESDFYLTVSTIACGAVSSLISAGVACLLLPITVSVVAGLVVGLGLGYLRFNQVKKERARQDEDKQWEQARAPLYLLQGEIQGLQTQIQQVERDTMDQLKTHINLMTIQMQRQLDNSYEQQAQTNVLIQTLYQKIEDLENQLQQVKEENTKPKTEEAQPKSESVSVMKRVA